MGARSANCGPGAGLVVFGAALATCAGAGAGVTSAGFEVRTGFGAGAAVAGCGAGVDADVTGRGCGGGASGVPGGTSSFDSTVGRARVDGVVAGVAACCGAAAVRVPGCNPHGALTAGAVGVAD